MDKLYEVTIINYSKLRVYASSDINAYIQVNNMINKNLNFEWEKPFVHDVVDIKEIDNG